MPKYQSLYEKKISKINSSFEKSLKNMSETIAFFERENKELRRELSKTRNILEKSKKRLEALRQNSSS